MVYDERIMTFKGLTHVSLLCLDGRELIPLRYGAYQAARLDRAKGQADLVLRDGTFYLFVTVDLPTPPPIETEGALGVDLGIVNIATDSDGNVYSGAQVNALRRRHRRLRAKLGRKFTRSARRLFHQRARKERRFATHTNHRISKQIVVAAAVLSMAWGAFAALRQPNIKRLMAYSSIGNVGYVLLGVAAGSEKGIQGVVFYLAIYMVMTLGVFAVILLMKRRNIMVENISDLAGLGRSHPLLAHVELGNVVLADSLVLQPPVGATTLIDSTAGPIAAIAPRDSYQDVVLGFEIVGRDKDGAVLPNTNWPRRHSFPTFWLNVLEYLAGGSGDTENKLVRPGRPIELHAPATADKVTVIAPDGGPATVNRTPQDAFPFHSTDKPGNYKAQVGDRVVDRFAVNLFDRAESDVRVRPTQDEEGTTMRAADIRIGNVDVQATAERAPARRELWKLILACALFVLVLEWYIYNRRVYL